MKLGLDDRHALGLWWILRRTEAGETAGQDYGPASGSSSEHYREFVCLN